MEEKRIELRSPQVRQIIGQIPPVLIRRGIGIILIIMLILILGSKYFSIPYTLKAQAEIISNKNNISVRILIPVSEEKHLKKNQIVVIYLDSINDLYQQKIELKISRITKEVNIRQNKAYLIAFSNSQKYLETISGLQINHIDKKYTFNAEIKAGKISFFDKVFKFLL